MSAARNEWSVVAMLEWATNYFKKKGIPDARFSIEWLLADVLGMKRLDLYLYFDRPLAQNELDELRPLLKRRARHEPLQYISGHADFLDTTLNVGPQVLIPRPETEQLVEIILENHSGKALSVLDIGTGSGCIAIALKKKRPEWQITGVDISTEALVIAKENAEKNNTAVQFLEYDILSAAKNNFHHGFDLIVSNPPYVLQEEQEMLEPQVVDYEPHDALFCDDIIQMYQKIIRFSAGRLNPKGEVYLEIHSGKKDEILPLFNNDWQANLLEDYGGKKRYIHAFRKQ